MSLRDELAEIIGIDIYNYNRNIEYKVLESVPEHGYIRQRIEYDSFGEWVPAFLLLPEKLDNNPAILINHQHNRERHLGKSEVSAFHYFGDLNMSTKAVSGHWAIRWAAIRFNFFLLWMKGFRSPAQAEAHVPMKIV